VVKMDEVTYLINLLNGVGISLSKFSGTNTWAASATSAGASGHQVTPTIIDIRNMVKNKGARYDLSRAASGESSSDLIVVFEDGQTLDSPTIDWSVRNETYSLTMHIRCVHDERGAADANYARDRLENLYKIVKHRIDGNRRGATVTVGSDSKRFDQIHLGNRTESNDRSKRIFGYKIAIEMKKFAVPL
jgi:hypothetical protein